MLAAGNAMVDKPSEYTPGSQWLADRFAEVVPEHPVLQVVHGLGDTGAALGRAGVDKLAVIGSTATAKKVMATCAETLTPILAEGGGKDAMIVAADHPGRRPRGLDRGREETLGPVLVGTGSATSRRPGPGQPLPMPWAGRCPPATAGWRWPGACARA